MVPFSWYENATAAIRDQNHVKWQSYAPPRPFFDVQMPGALVGCKLPRSAERDKPLKRYKDTSFYKHPSTLYKGLIERSNEPKLKPVRLPVALLAQER